MRTVFGNNDIKNILATIFSENTETIMVQDGNLQEEQDLAKFLNLKFYSWRNRVIEKNGENIGVDAWLESLNYSLNESYALVETTDSTVLASQDIDFASLTGRVTFLVQTNKIHLLDYYVNKIRNKYLGLPQDIQNSFGEMIKAYFNIGILIYNNEPEDTQFGETITASLNFEMTYLTEALSYNDIKIELSLDGQTYYQLPYLKASLQNTFTGEPVTVQGNPTRTGALNSSVSQGIAFTYYDFNKPLTEALDDIFWGIGDLSNNTITPNVPVYMRATVRNKVYNYQYVITSMQKDISNGEFATSTIILKTWGKANVIPTTKQN